MPMHMPICMCRSMCGVWMYTRIIEGTMDSRRWSHTVTFTTNHHFIISSFHISSFHHSSLDHFLISSFFISAFLLTVLIHHLPYLHSHHITHLPHFHFHHITSFMSSIKAKKHNRSKREDGKKKRLCFCPLSINIPLCPKVFAVDIDGLINIPI